LQFEVTMDAWWLLHSEVTDHPELQVSLTSDVRSTSLRVDLPQVI
jgi:hypothetical protein